MADGRSGTSATTRNRMTAGELGQREAIRANLWSRRGGRGRFAAARSKVSAGWGKLPRLAASCRGPGKLTAGRCKLPRIRATYRGSGKLTVDRGKLPRLRESFPGPGKLIAAQGKLPRTAASYRGSGQVTATQGKLPRTAASYRGPGKLSANRGKLARADSTCQKGGVGPRASWPDACTARCAESARASRVGVAYNGRPGLSSRPRR